MLTARRQAIQQSVHRRSTQWQAPCLPVTARRTQRTLNIRHVAMATKQEVR
jgi:hypothetical protein